MQTLWDCVRYQRVTSLVFEDKIGFQEEFQLKAALSHILKNLSNNLLDNIHQTFYYVYTSILKSLGDTPTRVTFQNLPITFC